MALGQDLFPAKWKPSLNFTVKSLFLILLFLNIAFAAHGQEHRVLFREGFSNLDNWKPLYFPKIERHTSYIVEVDEQGHFLKAESRASASALVFKHEFNVYEYPRMRWRWKVGNVYSRGDARTQKGNDYPLRIYILFKSSPDQVSFVERLKYGVAKMIYGEYPPHSSLNYIWANKLHPEHIMSDPHAPESKLILLQNGAGKVGRWLIQEVNLLADYQAAFGRKPPATATLAVMNDSDDTGESSVSAVDFIEVYR
jgi:hypothetical protein